MDLQQIREAALAQGVTPQALEAITTKVVQHFEGTSNPPPAEMERYIASLFVWDKLGMDKATFDSMPVTWRRAQGQAFQPPPLHARRPVMRSLTPAELESLGHLSGPAHTEAARQLQQTPAPEAS